MRHVWLAVLLVGSPLAIVEATAQQLPADDPCAGFAWSLAREQGWLAAPGLRRIVPGETLTADAPAAVLSLKRYDRDDLPHEPSREPKPNTYAGVVRLASPTSGTVQVTLSDEGWIDVFQGGTARKPMAHTGRKGCPGLRKSLRFPLDAGPVVIQITDARAETLRIAVAPVEETP